jgi:polyphosphate glucokinase
MASDHEQAPKPITLVIDIGGTGIKMLPVDADGNALGKRCRELTPRPAHPGPVLKVIAAMMGTQPAFDRVSMGFPGVIVRGVAKTAPNLDTLAWHGFDLQAAMGDLTAKPVRIINDADLQGYGVIDGRGLEMVLTLGTGLGSALYIDGHLVPNLELGHHPFKKGETYEQRISDAELERIGKKRFCKRVSEMLDQLRPIFNYDRLYLGGGNAKVLDPAQLPAEVKLFKNEQGLTGGVLLWED